MATGLIKTTKIDEIKLSASGAVSMESQTIDFQKTPEKPFNESNLTGIIRAVAAFAKELETADRCYRVYVRLHKGVRAPNGFNKMAALRNSKLTFLVNAAKAAKKPDEPTRTDLSTSMPT